MEYAAKFEDGVMLDENHMRYVGFVEDNPGIKRYFSTDTVKIISKKVTELLMGVDPLNRPIIVPDNRIIPVMNDIYQSFRPPTSDIYGRYNVPTGTGEDDYVQSMIDQTIEVITSDVRNNLEMEENNKKLTVWTTVYGNFNEHGLVQHPKIKVLNKRPNPMEFNMNY